MKLKANAAVVAEPQAVPVTDGARTHIINKYKRDFKKNWKLYLLFLPVFVYYIMFNYLPMYGAMIAFKDFNPMQGILGSPWVGFKHFIDFFTSTDLKRVLFNTLNISITSLVFGFPAPIILALMINEVKNSAAKRLVQTITYMPHFVSLVVVCGIITNFVSDKGIITTFLASLHLAPQENLLSIKQNFVPIYVISSIWQEVGWGSIIYLAALVGIPMEMYEAATIDGAGKWRQLFSITLPSLLPTIIVLLILRMGSIMSVGFEKIILLYNPLVYDTADVISSFVYRRGLFGNMEYSFASAVGLFNSVINFILIISANRISRIVNKMSIW